MTFAESVSTCFKKFNVRDGRARRSEYWYFHLFYLLLCILIGLVVVIAFPDIDENNGTLRAFSRAFRLFFLIPSLSVMVRRLHDTNRSGWTAFLILTGVGAIYILYLMCKEGDAGENQYGPDPKKNENDEELDRLLSKKNEIEEMGGDSVI